VRSLASYGAYYERWSLVWESQALLRAEPVAGDADLGRELMALVDPVRYRDGGIAEADVREIRRIKSRVEAERLPRGTDPQRHTKLGPGRARGRRVDVQLLQLGTRGSCPGCGRPGRSRPSRLLGRRAPESGAGPRARACLADREPGANATLLVRGAR
jgi:glutamate-ammonia-ligase adenylyltransferase